MVSGIAANIELQFGIYLIHIYFVYIKTYNLLAGYPVCRIMRKMILPSQVNMFPTCICVLLLVCGFFGNQVFASQKPILRGVSPQDRDYFSGANIRCRDGSKTIPIQRVNDEFCDCADGTDEPGTSACPSGKFYCRNRGHIPYLLFSSRVNDGICDCCDGSDEYEGRVTCANTCKEEGATSRVQLTEQVATYTEGLKLRNKIVEDAQARRESWAADIKKLQSEEGELKVKEAKLLEEKTAVEKAEREEREQREKLQKEQEAQEQALKEATKDSDPLPAGEQETIGEVGNDDSVKESPAADAAPHEDFDDDHDDFHTHGGDGDDDPEEPPLPPDGNVEENSESEVPPESGEENLEGLSKEEIGRRIASRWTGGGAEDQPPKPPPNEPEPDHPTEDEDHEDPPEDSDDEEPHGIDDDDEKDHHHHHDEGEYPGDDDDDAVDEQATILSEAEQVKKNHREVASQLRSLQNKLSDLEKKLKNDYGSNSEFISLVDQCFKLTINQYEYQVCPFKDAIQLEGHINTRLGTWEGFLDNYTKMAFRNGDKCWNGPERSMTVTLQCGLKTEIFSVDEPSRCEYAALMSTPAVCSASRAQELREELDEKVRELQGDQHDEL